MKHEYSVQYCINNFQIRKYKKTPKSRALKKGKRWKYEAYIK